jgi:hypothetical protein
MVPALTGAPDNVGTLTAEVFGQLGVRQDAIGVTEPRFQVGLRWRPLEEFSVDPIYGSNIYGENANWITLATVFRFNPGGSLVRGPHGVIDCGSMA